MARRKVKAEADKSIPELADESARKTVRGMCKDGKLTPQGRSLAKLMDRIMPDEKVDEWGWNLSRKERAAIKRRAAEKKAAEEKRRPRRVPAPRIVGNRGSLRRTVCWRASCKSTGRSWRRATN